MFVVLLFAAKAAFDLFYERGHGRRTLRFEIVRRVKFNCVVLDKNRDDVRAFDHLL